jgi:hypothetical protein
MAPTYELIASTVLSTTPNIVTFDNIPNTFTDLLLKTSTRNSNTGSNQSNYLNINNVTTGTLYSQTIIEGSGSSASSTRIAFFGDDINIQYVPSANNTANTFGNTEIYIPNYLASTNKPLSVISVSENNTTTAYINAHAGLFRSTNAITRLDIRPFNFSTETFVVGSSFFLYGIKNS